jgi:hypothetical protein
MSASTKEEIANDIQTRETRKRCDWPEKPKIFADI